MEEYTEISVNQIGIKCKSKKEVYNLLTTEGGYYLPPLADTHYKFISQILVGDKKALKWKDVKVCMVPHYKGLTIPEILQFARNHFAIDEFIPSYEYNKHPNRDWIWNIINTSCQAEFQLFIHQKISERVKHVISKKSMNIKVLPEFASIFESSKNISTERGRSHFLIKASRKRKWEEVKREDEEQLRETAKLNQILQEKVNSMKSRIDEYEKNQDELLKDREKLVKLNDEGIIDSDGECKLEDRE